MKRSGGEDHSASPAIAKKGALTIGRDGVDTPITTPPPASGDPFVEKKGVAAGV